MSPKQPTPFEAARKQAKQAAKHLPALLVAVLVAAAACVGSILFMLYKSRNGQPLFSDPGFGELAMFISGVVTLVLLFFLVMGAYEAVSQKNRENGTSRLMEALESGSITQEERRSVVKRCVAALVINTVIAGTLVFCWPNLLSIPAALCPVLSSVGAILLTMKGKAVLKTYRIVIWVAGFVMLLILIFVFPGSKSDDGKWYSYYVNGIKIGEGDGSTADFLTEFLGMIFISILFGCFVSVWANGIAVCCVMGVKRSAKRVHTDGQ